MQIFRSLTLNLDINIESITTRHKQLTTNLEGGYGKNHLFRL